MGVFESIGLVAVGVYTKRSLYYAKVWTDICTVCCALCYSGYL